MGEKATPPTELFDDGFRDPQIFTLMAEAASAHDSARGCITI